MRYSQHSDDGETLKPVYAAATSLLNQCSLTRNLNERPPARWPAPLKVSGGTKMRFAIVEGRGSCNEQIQSGPSSSDCLQILPETIKICLYSVFEFPIWD